MITLNQLSMAYGQKLLFYDANLNLNPGKRYALLGANGCGKSTFFRLITREEEPTSGAIVIPKSATLGWLKQDQFHFEDTPILDVVLQGKPTLWLAMKERDALLNDEIWDDAKGFRLGDLEATIAHCDGYTAIAQIETILSGLGVEPKYFNKPLKMLSGGYKLRVLLARTLFQNPSILLLDEPTNHLDIVSIRWLEQFLKTEFKGLVVFISHDSGFVDGLSDYILDLEYGEIRQYSGNYQKFISEKALIEEQKTVEKKSLENKVAVMQTFVAKFGAKASKAGQARSRMKMIEKIEIPDVKKSSRVAPIFRFIPKRASGKKVVTVSNISKSFKNKLLFDNASFELLRGERVAITGINGIGKSTLIKILTGMIVADSGSLAWGHEVHMSYFSQDHHEQLNRHVSVLQWLHETVSAVSEQQMRRILGQVLFAKDEVEKDVLSLSGGEAARLLLAKVMLESPNLLILDEPTNHMDLETIQALSSALSQYSGTLVFVSHDRNFIDAVATRILYFAPGKEIIDYKGNYSDFMANCVN